MKHLFSKISQPLSNNKGMELISYIGLMAIAVILGAVVWAATDASIGAQVTTIAELLNYLFS